MADDIFDTDYRISAHFYECSKSYTTEELYQAFKSRLMEELCLSPPIIPPAFWSHQALLARSLAILGEMIDPNDCTYDHHGNCQTHGWMNADIPCPHKRAKTLLWGESGKK